MACTSQPLATQAALRVLEKGGSAVDAAIAANAVLCVVEPTGCGVGGDLFAIVWDEDKDELHGLNASGRSPRGLSLEALKKELAARKLRRIPAYGALPVSVPGCVDGWCTLHARFGKLELREVLAPAIAIAREGFPVSELIAFYWRAGARRLREFPGFSEVFEPGGRAPRKGDVFRNPRLAGLLEKIAEGGRDAFYRGEVAATIARYVQEQGGFLSEEDLAAHRSEWVEPQASSYRGHTLYELPPNGQGMVAQQILNVLEGYDIASMGFGSARYLHLFTEAKKLAFEDRAKFYADPAFGALPLRGLLSKSYAEKRRALIDDERAAARYDAGRPELEEGDTVYLCTADRDGNMVSLIQSNYRGMGSGMTPPGLGFVLQDRGELFALEPGHANCYAPGKRPFHTIIPAFVMREGRPWMAFGVMGGAMQPQGHAQVLVNLIDFRMNLQEAGDAADPPRGQLAADGAAHAERRRVAPRARLQAGRARRARSDGAPRADLARRLRRISGDPEGREARDLDRGVGVAQGRASSGLLRDWIMRTSRRRRMRAIAVWAILCAPCSAQAGAAPKQSQDARARASLERLATQTSMRFESATRNYAFEARLKAARAAGRRSVELNTFHFEGLRSGDLVAWTARPKVAKAEPETRVLVRSGAHWLMRGRDGKWLRANRPTGVWVATYLPDPVYLARSLLRVREAKWTVRGETIDDKLLRVYRLQLGAEATRRLAESGVIPYSNDVTSGIGTTTHATFARESKNSQRALEIRLIEDPKTKLPLRFEFDVFEASVTFQIVRGAGGTRALAPVIDGKKREREDLELAFSAKLTLRDFGTARIDFEDELRALLAK